MQIYALSITYIHKRSNMYLLNEYFQLNKNPAAESNFFLMDYVN